MSIDLTTLTHDEPDGTSPYMIQNQRNLAPGEDWLNLTPAATDTDDKTEKPRVFKVGGKLIPDPDATKTIEDVKNTLKLMYPEVSTGTHKVTDDGEQVIVEFLPKAGKKG